VLLSLALTWTALKRQRERGAGLALSVAAFKPHLVLLVPVALLVSRHARAVLWWLIGMAFLVAVSVGLLSAEGTRQYLVAEASAKQSTYNVLASAAALFGYREPWAFAGQLALAALAVGTSRRLPDRLEYVLGTGVIASLLLTPYLDYYDYALLILPAAMWVRTTRSSWQVPIFAFLLVAGELVPRVGVVPLLVAELALWAGFTVTTLRLAGTTVEAGEPASDLAAA
jgi:hypothetical protein